MADGGKVSKASVKYSLGGDHCGACRFWIESEEDEEAETGACEKVAGPIKEDYWCKLFKRRRETIGGGGQ